MVDQVDLDSIEARERVTRHDVKARIEEFCALAGHEQIHKGMTSRDLTENVEQLQIRAALALVRDRMVAVLARLAELAAEHADTGDHRPQPQRRRPGHHAGQALRQRRRGDPAGLPTASRSCSPATRCGASRARWAPSRTSSTCSTATSTGSTSSRRPWPATSASTTCSTNVGQVYPRSLDLDVVSALVQAAAGPSSLALTIRLMAGHELATEGFQPGSGRFVGHAPQDEHPLVRAHQRLRGDPPGPSHDGRRPGRRPVERGRRELLGGAPRGAARRVLRHRRRVRDAADGARGTSAPTRP